MGQNWPEKVDIGDLCVFSALNVLVVTVDTVLVVMFGHEMHFFL